MDTSVATPRPTATGLRAIVSAADGVQELRGLEVLPGLFGAGKLFWLDLVGRLDKDGLAMLRQVESSLRVTLCETPNLG
jgi:hypothetical protein